MGGTRQRAAGGRRRLLGEVAGELWAPQPRHRAPKGTELVPQEPVSRCARDKMAAGDGGRKGWVLLGQPGYRCGDEMRNVGKPCGGYSILCV